MLHFEQPQQGLAGCGYPGELFFRGCRIRTGSIIVQVARSICWGAEVRYRQNIPLAVLSVISVAILCLFGVAEAAMRDMQRQHDSCGGSRQAAISQDASSPAALSHRCRQAAFPG
jgi:hypothetical protein